MAIERRPCLVTALGLWESAEPFDLRGFVFAVRLGALLSHQELELRRVQWNHREPSLPHQGRVRKEFVSLDFSQ